MTAIELALLLSSREYGQEISPAEEQEAKAAGLVVVYGSSDDCVEFRGAIQDEISAYGGADIYVGRNGLLPEMLCGEKNCPYLASAREAAQPIYAIWRGDSEGPYWTLVTKIPHETFTIYEDQEPFCEGIIFRMEDIGKADNPPLTLDELREMDGESVWVIQSGYTPRCHLVDVSWKAQNVIYLYASHGPVLFAEMLLADGAKIYRQKPKEGTT